ncbi:hypothetical protein BGZ90_002990, partial [Linnemannia elongata]
MEAASKRYFNIPELADALGQRLDKGTISSLVATSRHLKTLFEPWLYHELTLSYLDNSGRLLKSADSLRALARNMQHVRWLMCDQEEIGFLFNCLLAAQEAAAAETTDDLAATVDGADIGTLSLSATPRPRWVPALETSPPSGTVIIPLPPMHCLTYLEVNLMPLGSIHWPAYRFPKSASSARKTLRQTCWIIQQCPNLLALELDLADDWQGIEEDEENEEELDIPEIRRREEPLVNLTKFVAWGMDGSTTTDVLTVFDHCPNVRILKVPSVSFEQKELTSLATSITTRCPHIRTLSLLDNEDGKLLLRLMEVMPANTLQKVKLNNFEYLLYPMTSRQIFANHARSLKIVDLRYTMYLSSQDMLTILEVCVALEEFKKHPNLDSGDDFMTLQDAVSIPWASKRIRHLELTIGIPDDFGHSPYYARLERIPL